MRSFVQFIFLVVASIASASGQVTFVSPSSHLGFSLAVPTDNINSNNTDLYVAIAMPSNLSWGAVGLGNTKMQHTLVLMVYASASGNNVTLSPRLAPKHGEPVYEPSIQFTTLAAGTGIANGTLTYSGVCHNCRTWSGGSIDVTSTVQGAIFANGPKGAITSDSGAAPIKYHAEYGAFVMNMTAATGSATLSPLVLLQNNVSSGTTLDGSFTTGAADNVAVVHAVVMIVTFFVLMPLGVLLLRVGQSAHWHGINQTVSLAGAVGGSVLGFTTSSSYVRSSNFTTGHQLIGIFLFVFVLAQFTLGFYHHRIFKRTQQTTKLAPVHVWLGRVVIVGGVVDAFLGFPLALNPMFDLILAAMVVVLTPTYFVMLYTGSFTCRRHKPFKRMADENLTSGYVMNRV